MDPGDLLFDLELSLATNWQLNSSFQDLGHEAHIQVGPISSMAS